jgi:hypothetical protein
MRAQRVRVIGTAVVGMAFVAVVAGLAARQIVSPPAPARSPMASAIADASVAPPVAASTSPSLPVEPSASALVDQPPTVVRRDFHVRPGQTVRRSAPGVLLGARDPEGLPVFVSGRGDAAHGRVSINASGALQYTPDPGFEGRDAVTWTASDGSRTTTVTTTFVVDGTAPRIYRRWPAVGELDVPVDAPVSVEFNELMWTGWAGDLVWPITVRDLVTGRLVAPRSVSLGGYSGKVSIEFAPFVGGRMYRVTVASRMRDLAGNRFSGASWTFRTANDATPPRIVDPMGSSITIHPSDPIRLTFNEPLREDTVTMGAIDFRQATGNQSTGVPFTLEYDPVNWTVSLWPLQGLDVGADYRLRVRDQIKDLVGNTTGFAGFEVTVVP